MSESLHCYSLPFCSEDIGSKRVFASAIVFSVCIRNTDEDASAA